MAQDHTEADTQTSPSSLHVTHILGFEDRSKNANGDLSIEDGHLRFQKSATSSAQITLASIQDLTVGEQDKQVGGVPMMVAKSAAPYGGGRVVSLFSHKKYDTVTLEYLDTNAGLHGAIFQMNNGDGEILKSELQAAGAQITHPENEAPTAVSPATGNDASRSSPDQWSVQVNGVEPGDVSIGPAFRIAIYENMSQELRKTKQFKQVLRSGDRDANAVPDLLILKTTIVSYAEGSETRRAVTTVSGATKLKIRSQLCTRDGQIVQDRELDGNVRFFGDNLRATHNLAHNVANAIKHSSLPEPTRSALNGRTRNSSDELRRAASEDQ